MQDVTTRLRKGREPIESEELRKLMSEIQEVVDSIDFNNTEVYESLVDYVERKYREK